MEKMKKIKNMCELEKYVGEMAHKKLMFCKGFYLVSAEQAVLACFRQHIL